MQTNKINKNVLEVSQKFLLQNCITIHMKNYQKQKKKNVNPK